MTDLRHRNLLICADVPPQSTHDAASRRLFHFVEFLRAAGCGVTCVARNPRGDDRANPLAATRATVVVGDDDAVVRLASAEWFDWALLGSWSGAAPLVERLRTVSPATKIVVDAGPMDLLRHMRRDGRVAEDAVRDTVRELDVYAAADAVFVASRTQADLVGDLIGDRRRAFVVPDSEDLAASPFPFRKRRGLFFAGDFSHRSDVDALIWLGDEILPHVDPAALADNPLTVAGSHMTDDLRGFAADWPSVRMIGRVPSVVPYLQRVRGALVPPLHGAEARRSLIQALAIGTPAVTTSGGIDGLPIADEREVLVADHPVRFAAGITRLLTDEPLWTDLARSGREAILARHGHDVARRRLEDALVAVRCAAPTARQPARARRMTQRDYEATLDRAREAIVRGTPPDATVAVVSRGDVDAVRLAGRTGWHFPLGDQGDYAGFYPATGSEAVDHLESVRARGAEFFAIPAPSVWWLGHYRELRAHLESRYRVIEADGGSCVLVSLREPPTEPQSLAALVAGQVADDDRPATVAFEGLSDRHTVTRPPAGLPPAISVVIATRDSAALLAEALDGLARQTTTAAFEVVVVNDGSIDGTADVCRDLAGRLRLTVVESPPAGISAARNLGLAVAAAPLVLFLEDDVVGDPGLVAAHLAAHRRMPLEHVAVLGSTAWHPRLQVTELMRFIAAMDPWRFGAPPLFDGQPLDHTAFRSARSSCKKSLLVRAGGFRPELAGGAEDVEAGHRISRMLAREQPSSSGFTAVVGLTVVSCRDAVQHVIRPPTYDDFCRHCERQGRSAWQFSRLAADQRADEWWGVHGADERWRDLRGELAARVALVHTLEREAAIADPEREELARQLHALYAWSCDAFRTKGIVEAAGHA